MFICVGQVSASLHVARARADIFAHYATSRLFWHRARTDFGKRLKRNQMPPIHDYYGKCACARAAFKSCCKVDRILSPLEWSESFDYKAERSRK
jgi:hypothetical protein